MIKQILNNRYSFHWTVFHILLGVLSAMNKFAVIGWFFFVIASEVDNLIGNNYKVNIKLNNVIIYLCAFEVWARMAKCSPFIPYELTKYMLTALFLYGILLRYNRGLIGWLMVVLILPAMFYNLSDNDSNLESLLFNAGGPINLALGVVYFKDQEINQQQLFNLIKLGLLPLISALVFAFVRTPDYDTIDFSLSANFDTSGGFGSNQVSTILGLGLFFMFLLWLTGKVITGYRFLDAGLIMGFAFQGLLTFSRGGMFGSAIAILVVLFFITLSGDSVPSSHKINLPKIGLYIIPLILLGLIVFQVANTLTGNNLSLRYRGETAGTIAGSKELDLNTFTTNRYQIFLGDVELWRENFLLGVGVGASKELRPTTEEVPTAAHVELSRLLAEHGLFGLFFFLTILVFPFLIISQNKDSLNKAILIAFFIIGLYTSFHAAMRTYVTPLFISMSLLTIRENPHKKKTKPYLDSVNLLDSQ